MRTSKLICWLRGHFWRYHIGTIEGGPPQYYCCGRCGKRA
jgi:hypothetical protein